MPQGWGTAAGQCKLGPGKITLLARCNKLVTGNCISFTSFPKFILPYLLPPFPLLSGMRHAHTHTKQKNPTKKSWLAGCFTPGAAWHQEPALPGRERCWSSAPRRFCSPEVSKDYSACLSTAERGSLKGCSDIPRTGPGTSKMQCWHLLCS